MAFDEIGDEEHPRDDSPLPPEDRLWRHPSELGGGVPVPSAWPTPPTPRTPRRAMAISALAGACLTGAAVVVALVWVSRAPDDAVRQTVPVAARVVSTEAGTPAGLPSQSLIASLAPSLVQVAAARGDRWTTATGLRLDGVGTIVVAAALIDGAGPVKVRDQNGLELPAVVKGMDLATGIAVLNVESEGEPIASPPAEARAGQTVAVISTEANVVSASVQAIGLRSAVDLVVLHDAMHLDRSVPEDAMGAVVVDAEGNLVGIVVSGSGTDAVAVVAPAADALAAARELRDDGEVRRAWLGVRAVDLVATEQSPGSSTEGALLTMVQAGSPAAKSGLHAGDVITAVDDVAVGDASDLVMGLRSRQPGDRVLVRWRRGQTQDQAEVTLG